MSRITDLLAKYAELLRVEEELERRKEHNENVRQAETTFSAEAEKLKEEINALRRTEAKKIWEGMDQERFSYEVFTGERDVYHPYVDRTETYHESRAYVSVMGLKLLAGSVETNGRVASVDEILAANKFNPSATANGLLKKFEIDPEGTRKAVAETLRVRFMKDKEAMPIEIKKVSGEIEEIKEKIEKLEKLIQEEVPDNAIMRKIFKKKFEAKAKAPKELAALKDKLVTLETQKDNYEYRLEMAEKFKTEEDILRFVDEEYKYLVALCERDYEKEVSATSQAHVETLKDLEVRRKANKDSRENDYEIDAKRRSLETAFNKDFASLEELYGDKEFVEELKSIDFSTLSEDDRKVITALRESYEQHLMKTVQKYEE